MAAANKTVWGIHTMDDPLFLNQNLIAIGWEEMGDLSAIGTSRDAYKEKYIAAYPDAKKGSIATSAGMLYRFVHEVQEGDYVVFPSKIDRKINIGVVESAYFYEATAAMYPNRRKVKWLKHLPRTAFSQGALVPTVTQKIKTEVFFRVDHACLALKTAVSSQEALANLALKTAVFSLVRAKNA